MHVMSRYCLYLTSNFIIYKYLYGNINNSNLLCLIGGSEEMGPITFLRGNYQDFLSPLPPCNKVETSKCQGVQKIAKNKLKNKLKVFKELNIVKSPLVTKSELKKVILSRKIDNFLLWPQINNLLKQC